MKWNKHVLGIAVCGLLMSGITACSGGNGWIFSLNGEKVREKDVAAYGIIYAKEYNVNDIGQLSQEYEDGETYAEYWKQGLEDDIVSSVLLYREAKNHGKELSDKQKQEAEQKAEDIVNVYGTQWLNMKHVSQEELAGVYEKKLLGDAYVAERQGNLTAGESETGQSDSPAAEEKEAGQSGSLSATENQTANVQQLDRYVKVYQVLFPTVSLDESGMIQSDAEGNIKRISSDKADQRKQDAEEYAKKARAGEDMQTLLADYGESVTGGEQVLEYDGLQPKYKEAVDGLSEGGVSNVFEMEYGYYVVKLLEENATEHAEIIANYEAQSRQQNERAVLLDELYKAYVGADKKYKNEKRWEQISIADYIRNY